MICEDKPYNLANDEMSSTGSSCELCEFAITKLDEMLEDKHNEQEIKDALGKLCDYMPMSITDECKAFVSTYTDTIIEMLTHDVTPKEVNLFIVDLLNNILNPAMLYYHSLLTRYLYSRSALSLVCAIQTLKFLSRELLKIHLIQIQVKKITLKNIQMKTTKARGHIV